MQLVTPLHPPKQPGFVGDRAFWPYDTFLHSTLLSPLLTLASLSPYYNITVPNGNGSDARPPHPHKHLTCSPRLIRTLPTIHVLLAYHRAQPSRARKQGYKKKTRPCRGTRAQDGVLSSPELSRFFPLRRSGPGNNTPGLIASSLVSPSCRLDDRGSVKLEMVL